MTDVVPPIEDAVTVAVPPQRAFQAFKNKFAAWWPRAYTYAGEDGLRDIGLGAAEGDLCSELGPHGFRVDWGRMLVVQPPARLVLLWQIAPDRTPQPDPMKSSEVEVTFDAAPAGTQVRLVHRAFERCGEGGAAHRQALAADEGWRFILGKYAAYLAG